MAGVATVSFHSHTAQAFRPPINRFGIPQLRSLRTRSRRTHEPLSNNKNKDVTELEVSEDKTKLCGLSDKEVKDRTMEWLQKIVIGLSLCPFAERPLKEEKLDIQVVRGIDEDEILIKVAESMSHRAGHPGTSLVVAPDFSPNDFESYLSFFNVIENGVIKDLGLVGKVQVASFHPKFCFAEADSEDDVSNFTNRSPFPIFHVLREAEVTRAVHLLQGDPSLVWQRNVDLLEEMEESLGTELTIGILSGSHPASHESKVTLTDENVQAVTSILEENPAFQPPGKRRTEKKA